MQRCIAWIVSIALLMASCVAMAQSGTTSVEAARQAFSRPPAVDLRQQRRGRELGQETWNRRLVKVLDRSLRQCRRADLVDRRAIVRPAAPSTTGTSRVTASRPYCPHRRCSTSPSRKEVETISPNRITAHHEPARKVTGASDVRDNGTVARATSTAAVAASRSSTRESWRRTRPSRQRPLRAFAREEGGRHQQG